MPQTPERTNGGGFLQALGLARDRRNRYDVVSIERVLEAEQQAQAAALIGDWMASDAWTSPAMLVGDFNAAPYTRTYRMLARALRDAQHGLPFVPVSTFPSKFPFMRIDHVFLAGPWKVRKVETPYSGYARIASDHLPLVIDFHLSAKHLPVGRMPH